MKRYISKYMNLESYIVDDVLLFSCAHCQSSAGAGELDDEDEEEDQHVEEEHHLVVLHGPDQPHHGDEEKKHSTSCDASNNGQTGHYTRHFT